MGKKPLIIGHRGACAYYPENTMIAFEQGLKQGAEMFELDVNLTKDGVPVVIHDDNLERVTGTPGFVSQTLWSELKTKDVGSHLDPKFKDARISTLEDILNFIVPQVPIDLELKVNPGDPKPLVDATAKVIKKLGFAHRIMISSFRHDALPLMEKAIPGIMTAKLIDIKDGPLGDKELEDLKKQPLFNDNSENQLPYKGRMLCLHYKLATPEFTKDVLALGGGILVWTVNEPELMLKLAQIGVTGIISNKPDLLKATLSKY